MHKVSPTISHLICFIWYQLCQDAKLSLMKEPVKAIYHSYSEHEGDVKHNTSFHLLSVENLDLYFSQAKICPQVASLLHLPLHLTVAGVWLAATRF